MTLDAELAPIPAIPDDLQKANTLGTLIPFVGAGASRLAGCPGWSEFADGALKHFVRNGKLDHAQLAQLSGVQPRVKLSLARSLAKEHGPPVNFQGLLHPSCRSHPEGMRLYGSLSRLGRTFVTTNYDEWLDEQLSPPSASVDAQEQSSGASQSTPRLRHIYYKPDELTAANLNTENTVLHLHGSVKDAQTMVITTSDYVRHYANDRRSKRENPVLTFLDFLFGEKIVLFVGYGLEELEILEYVILKSQLKAEPGMAPRHFMLQGYYSHERALMREMRKYYREFGIELLPYLMDFRGWNQLLEVLDDFAAKMPAGAIAELQMFEEMRAMLNDT